MRWAPVLAVLFLPAPVLADPPPAFLGAWGSHGSGAGQFNQPVDVSVGPNGDVFVLDSGNQRIEIFSNAGEFIGQWSIQNPPASSTPAAIAVGPGAEVYVLLTYFNYVDYEGHGVIQRYSVGSALLGSNEVASGWETTSFNCPDLAVDLNGDVLVPMSYSYTRYPAIHEGRVARFTHDLQSLGTWGGAAGSSPVQIPINVEGIAVNPIGHILLTDATGPHVNEFMGDGTFVAQWGSSGSGDGQFQTPWSIAVTPNGLVIVTDVNRSRVQEFGPAGQFASVWGSEGSGPGQFSLPIGVAVDAAGSIYVADAGNDRIEKFGSGPTPIGRVSWGAIKTRYR